jgi:hypothetical protein
VSYLLVFVDGHYLRMRDDLRPLLSTRRLSSNVSSTLPTPASRALQTVLIQLRSVNTACLMTSRNTEGTCDEGPARRGDRPAAVRVR